MKTPEVYGYVVMATNKLPYKIHGQYAMFPLLRDAQTWARSNFGEHHNKEIRNILVKISIH